MRLDNRSAFVERDENHDKNRDIAKRIKVSPALLANGRPGVLLTVGRQIVTLNRAEVAEFARLLLDGLDEAQAPSQTAA